MINMYQYCPFAANTLCIFQCQEYTGRNNVRQSVHSKAKNEVLSRALKWRWKRRPRLLNGAVTVNTLPTLGPVCIHFLIGFS